jgi:hypothetical protein
MLEKLPASNVVVFLLASPFWQFLGFNSHLQEQNKPQERFQDSNRTR